MKTSDSNYMTVRLSRGAHRSPADGACVMELASMIAGEPFTDHPRSVSRVIAQFLRHYNDRIDDERRQTLYRCAAAIVGTRAGRLTERARLRRLHEFARARSATLGRAGRLKVWAAAPLAAGEAAAAAVERGDGGAHQEVLDLVDELVDIDGFHNRIRSVEHGLAALAPRAAKGAEAPAIDEPA